MSSRSVQIIGGPSREHAWVDAATNALLVKLVNPGGGGGGGVQYNEDTAHASGDTGTMALVVRNDAGTSLVGADGDYAPLQVDASGALRVTGGGGGTQYAEDSAHSTGHLGTLALVVRQDAPGSLVGTDGDYAALQVDATGRLRVAVDAAVALSVSNFPATQAVTQSTSPWVIGDGGGSLTVDGAVSVSNFPAVYPVNDNGGSLTVDGTVAATQSGVWTVGVSGTVAATQSGAWSVGVNNFPAVYPVNDNGGSLTVDGTVAATQSGVWTTTVTQATHNNLNANANIQIGDVDVGAANPVPVSDNGGSLTVDGTVAVSGTVAVTQSGAWTVAATQSGVWTVAVSGTVAATQSGAWFVGQSGAWTVAVNNFPAVYPINDNGGSLTVDGTVAVTQSTSPWAVSGTVAVTQSTHANLNATVRVQDGDSSRLMDIISTFDIVPLTVAHAPTVMMQFPSDTPAPPAGSWQHLICDEEGRLVVKIGGDTTVGIFGLVPGTSSVSLGKAEDAAHTTGDVGVMALAVRNDTDASLVGTNGDYAPLQVSNVGRLKGEVQMISGDGSGNIVDVIQSGLVPTGSPNMNGIAPMFEVTIVGGPSLVVGNFGHGYLDEAGNILTATTVMGGSLSVFGLVPGVANNSLGKAEDAAHSGGDTGVMVLAVRNDAQTALAGTTGDYIPLTTSSTGSLWVAQNTHNNLRTQAQIIGGASAQLMDIVTTGDTSPAGAGGPGIGPVVMFEVTNSPTVTEGTWSQGFIERTTAGLQVHIVGQGPTLNITGSITALTPGSTALALGKLEDAAHASGDLGVMSLAVRRDTLTALATTNGDYIPLATTSLGALWVKEAGLTTVVLSGSTRGRPIQITGTTSGAANTIHTATTTAGELDRLYLWLTNTSTAAVTVTIEFGTTGVGNELDIVVPANETVLAVDGAVIGGAATDTVKAYAGTGSVVNAFGRVERLS